MWQTTSPLLCTICRHFRTLLSLRRAKWRILPNFLRLGIDWFYKMQSLTMLFKMASWNALNAMTMRQNSQNQQRKVASDMLRQLTNWPWTPRCNPWEIIWHVHLRYPTSISKDKVFNLQATMIPPLPPHQHLYRRKQMRKSKRALRQMKLQMESVYSALGSIEEMSADPSPIALAQRRKAWAFAAMLQGHDTTPYLRCIFCTNCLALLYFILCSFQSASTVLLCRCCTVVL